MAVRLDLVLSRGVAEGVISDEQAERLRSLAVGVPEPVRGERPAAPPATTEAPSLVTEALGYLGGVILLVGTILVGSQFWMVVGAGGRLAMVVLATAVLVVAGGLVPEGLGPATIRFRAVLLGLSVVAFTAAVSTLFYDVIQDDAAYVSSVIYVVATTYAFVLWVWWPTVLQLAMVAVGTAITAGLVAGLLFQPFAAAALGLLVVGGLLVFAAIYLPRRKEAVPARPEGL